MTNIDKMAQDALKRIIAHINRMAGQNKRQMLAKWRAKK